MKLPTDLKLSEQQRCALWKQINNIVETYLSTVSSVPVAPPLSIETLRTKLGSYTFNESRFPDEVVDFVSQGLWKHQVHTPHPRYFGLFNPAPTTMGIAGDTLTAVFILLLL